MNRILFACAFILALSSSFNASAQEIVTPSGHRFFMRRSTGGAKAQPGDNITVHMAVFIGDSLMHNSRAGDPDGIAMPLPPKEQLDANTSWPVVVDAALMMAAGDSATIFMKLDSFILSMLPPRLHSEKEVRYEMKLLSIESAEQINIMREKARVRQKMVAEKVTATTASYRQGELDSRLLTLPSGLKMLIEQPGDGAEFQQGGMVRAHYYGCLTDGTHFDDSYTRGQPLEFQAGVGQMIAGFDEGVMQLRRGGKAFLFIPPALGYGDAGAGGVIPPNATLVFYIELL